MESIPIDTAKNQRADRSPVTTAKRFRIRERSPVQPSSLSLIGLLFLGMCGGLLVEPSSAAPTPQSTINSNQTINSAATPPAIAPGKQQPAAKPSAQNNAKTNAVPPPQQPNGETQPEISNVRRAELMRFVHEHHPEIRPLLNSLQTKSPQQYAKTLSTLDREVRSLQQLEKRAPARYEVSLAHWIAKSETKLLSAQLALEDDEPNKKAIRIKIRQLLQSQINFRIQLFKIDADNLRKRLDKSQAQIERLKADRAETVERQLEVIVRQADRQNAKRKRAESAADQKKSKKPPTKLPQPNKSPDKQ